MEKQIGIIENIILIDSSSEIEKLLPLINKNSVVYAFDYDTHKKLSELGISHKNSESILNNNNITEIQNNVYKFSYWYNNKEFSEFVFFNEINIGRLFHEEFLDYIVQFFKKFYEIHFLIEHHPKSKFIAGGELFEILYLMCKTGREVAFTKKEYLFTHDKVRFSIPLGSKNISLILPFSFYKKIKNISENFFRLILKKFTYPSVLFVEFDTIRYKKLIQSGKKYGVPISLFGIRRPSIWNFESYKIIKNSNSKIITQSSLLSHNRFDNTDHKKITNNFELLFQTTTFKNYFSLFDIEFSSLIKKILKSLILPRINSILLDIITINSLFLKHKITSIMLLSEVGYTEQLVQFFARKHHIPTYMLHLGLHYDTIEAKEMNFSQSAYPVNSDKFFVWGNIVKEDAKIHGNIPDEKIIITGNPRFDDYSSLNTKNEDYVLIATSGPQHEDINGLLIANHEKYVNAIYEICKILKSLNKKFIIKLHPSIKEFDVAPIVNEIDNTIPILKDGEIFPLIQKCSYMIILGLSTAIIEAQILQKPVISVKIIDYNLGNPSVFASKSCIVSNIDSLENNLKKLENADFRKDVISNANNFLNNYLLHRNNATESFFENLKKLNNY
ncbi:hypothetical protein [Nitrosarchaeum sp.]|uniref:hypothetical protein n=1 Tax=Nitrosarchaeum sp. TaxID=2026886 RepID=UPI00247BA518|nr:hypothetical protein [Nitrosarchaeum sp.]MCV0411910.1 hypothetical protein [Nitrosarchaeum sp.]